MRRGSCAAADRASHRCFSGEISQPRASSVGALTDRLHACTKRPDGAPNDAPPPTQLLPRNGETPVLDGGFEARPTGFEPVTFGSVDRRSIQLSYGRVRASEDSGRAVMAAVRGASGEGGIRTRDGT